MKINFEIEGRKKTTRIVCEKTRAQIDAMVAQTLLDITEQKPPALHSSGIQQQIRDTIKMDKSDVKKDFGAVVNSCVYAMLKDNAVKMGYTKGDGMNFTIAKTPAKNKKK